MGKMLKAPDVSVNLPPERPEDPAIKEAALAQKALLDQQAAELAKSKQIAEDEAIKELMGRAGTDQLVRLRRYGMRAMSPAASMAAVSN